MIKQCQYGWDLGIDSDLNVKHLISLMRNNKVDKAMVLTDPVDDDRSYREIKAIDNPELKVADVSSPSIALGGSLYRPGTKLVMVYLNKKKKKNIFQDMSLSSLSIDCGRSPLHAAICPVRSMLKEGDLFLCDLDEEIDYACMDMSKNSYLVLSHFKNQIILKDERFPDKDISDTIRIDGILMVDTRFGAGKEVLQVLDEEYFNRMEGKSQHLIIAALGYWNPKKSPYAWRSEL